MAFSHLILVFIFSLVLSLAAASTQAQRVQIGSTHLCVPWAEAISTSSEWIQNNSSQLKYDGVAFTLINETFSGSLQYEPALNIFGKPMPISGTLGPSRSDEWLSQLPASNYWRRLVEGPNAIIEIDSGLRQIRAFQSPSRDRWIV